MVGLTELLPLAGRLVPPLIDTLSASVVVQFNVADSLAVIVVGVAEKLSTVGGPGGAGLTVTVTFADVVPPVPVAVSVYVVVVIGLTELLPSTDRLGPPLIDTLSASVVVQFRVADSPTVIEVGVAEKLSMVGGPGGAELTVTVTNACAAPAGPMAVRI